MDFQCLACTMIETKFATFTEICSHLQQEHGVEDVLASPATKAVLLPTCLGVHTCLLCTRKEHYLGKHQILDHLGESHSIFFQKEWGTYTNTKCR